MEISYQASFLHISSQILLPGLSKCSRHGISFGDDEKRKEKQNQKATQ